MWMITNKSRSVKKQKEYNEEKIMIKNFSSIDKLKDEIRKKMSKHGGYNIEFGEISSDGSFISIKFRTKS
jgi:hypothetical protein